MKRAGNMYGAIAEPENLRLAFWKAARGKRDRHEVIAFSSNLERSIQRLRGQLLRHRPDIGHYRFFAVYDPKPRNICAASFPEWVLHHAVMNLCEPVLDRYSIFDSYACRKDKGNRKAVARAREFTEKNDWYLQLDIRKYFDSIDHRILLDLLRRRFKDRELLALFEKLLATYHTAPGRGLPIGNLVSQHLANFYLGPLDHWLKEERRIKHYLRYMDDFILFGPEREYLKKELAEIRPWLRENLGLELKKDIKLNRTGHGPTFLGFRILPGVIRLSGRSKKRFARRFRQYEGRYRSGLWSEEELIRHMEPLIDFTRVAEATGFRRKVLEESFKFYVKRAGNSIT